MRALYVVAAGVAVAGAALFARRAAASPASAQGQGGASDAIGSAGEFDSLLFNLGDLLMNWRTRAEPYAAGIRAAAARHGVPGDLLVRVAYQESRFRPEVISGQVSSPVGARGMFQFMSGTAADFGVNLSDGDWRDDAEGAATYLARLHAEFGNWPDALAGYNWGQGNVRKWKQGLRTMPRETQNYVAEISADVGIV